MKRLTVKADDGTYAINKRYTAGNVQEAVDRLAAYEDTGLDPLEIETLKTGTCLGCSVPELKEGQALHKEWEEAYQQGRLVVLPCKVGDTVYAVKFATHEENEDGDLMPISGGGEWVIWTVRAGIINYCDYRTKNTRGYVVGSTQNGSGVTFDFNDFGKTVFLTREEAERALAGGADHA